MFAALIAGALLSLSPHANPCDKPLPRGPAVPAPIMLSTDCGWFRLETDGAVTRMPVDWYARHKRPWRSPYGLAVRRTHTGRYIVLRDGRVVWRSAGYYYNEAGSVTFGPNEFAFDSYGRRGVFLTDLKGPERLVLHGKHFYPIDFTPQGELLVGGRRAIVVISRRGKAVRRYRYRRPSSYAVDEQRHTVYFVAPRGMLSAARGSKVRRIAKISARGFIGLLGRRMLTFTGPHHVAVVGRDGSFLARASWRRAHYELDAGVSTSDDGRLFAFRVSDARAGARHATSVLYLLRASERRARPVFRDGIGQTGCGTGASLLWHGSSLLYRSVDSAGVAKLLVFSPHGSTALTPLLHALPRISRTTPGDAFWASDFLP